MKIPLHPKIVDCMLYIITGTKASAYKKYFKRLRYISTSKCPPTGVATNENATLIKRDPVYSTKRNGKELSISKLADFRCQD